MPLPRLVESRVPDRELRTSASSLSPNEYERYVEEEVFPLLDQALNETVPSEFRENERFNVRVIYALLERVDEEYTGRLNSSGAV